MRNVPKLRFSGFSDEWNKKHFSDIAERVVSKNKGNITKRPLTISAQYGLIDQEEFFNKIIASKNMEGYYLLNKGEFAYNKSYSNGYPFGAIKRLDKYENGAVSTLYVCFKNTKKANSDFLVQYFESDKWYKEISMIAVEGARNHGLLNISVTDFFDTIHTIPSLEEQEKIASFLTKVDKLIEKQDEKVSNLGQYKKGMMKKIFSREIRFKKDDGGEYMEWKGISLGDFLDFYSTNSLSRENLNNEKGKIKNIHYGDIHMKFPTILDVNKNDIPFINNNVDISNIKVESFCKDGDLIIADASEDYNDIGKAIEIKNLGRDIVVAGLHTILARDNKKNTAIGFKGYMLLDEKVRKQIKVLAAGAKVLGISKSNLAKVVVNLPCLEEQTKIANFLSKIDLTLEKEKKKLEELRCWKKGLLQKLFV